MPDSGCEALSSSGGDWLVRAVLGADVGDVDVDVVGVAIVENVTML